MLAAHSSWGRRVAAMATIAASGVAVIYIPQPIQTLVAADFAVPASASSAALIAVQAGYALGIVLLVSLGDRVSARRQVTVQLVATAAALALAAAAPSYALHVGLCFVAGGTATVGQLLVSSALRLAPPDARARTVAVLLGSFLIGLFTVRTALGSLAAAIGWRGALVVCAAIVLALVPLSLRVSPRDVPADPPTYWRILSSIPGLARSAGILRLMTAVHVLCFMAFIATWSMITLHATSELGLDVAQAALFGLAGLLGGAATIAAAEVHGRVGPRWSLATCLAIALIGAILITLGAGSVPLLALGLLMLSAGMSSEQVTTQAIGLASVDPSENGRANTIFMAATFFGGTLSTAIAATLSAAIGYRAVGALTIALIVIAASLALVADRRGMLRSSSAR